MTNTVTKNELKQALHNVFLKYRSVMSSSFKNELNNYYASPEADVYINRMKYYVDLFDKGQGHASYTDFINEVRTVLTKVDVPSEAEKPKAMLGKDNASSGAEKPKDVLTKVNTAERPKPAPKVEPTKETKPKSDKKATEPSKKVVSEPMVKQRATVEQKPKQTTATSDQEVDIQVSKAKPHKPNESIIKQTRSGKHSITDLTTKTIKFTIPTGLMDLFEQHFNEVAKTYLMGTGLLNEIEMQVLAGDDLPNAKIYKTYDFTLTRSDLFTILILLGLTHLNVGVKDDTISDVFDNNDIKVDFYQQLLNTNSVELDVQARVRGLQQKVEKSVGQNERIETMLQLLLLERANVPKNQNRETIKGALETSSVMNQSLESFGVLDRVVGNKVASIKDYKRARGG